VLGSRSDAADAGTLFAPKFYTTYQGKSFGSPTNYWYLMDAERSEFVNENKYGAREFVGSTWSTSAEYPLPLSGSGGPDPTSTAVTCSASNGAQWDHYVVPMANDTSFGTSTKHQLEADAEGVDERGALGKGIPLAASTPPATSSRSPALSRMTVQIGSNDEQHSVDGYMSLVKSRDGAACWENSRAAWWWDGLPRGRADVAVGGVNCGADACFVREGPKPRGLQLPAVLKPGLLPVAGSTCTSSQPVRI